MGRIRTHNNRRRARELKQGGLYTLRYGGYAGPTWAERGASPEDIRADLDAGIEAFRKVMKDGG